MPLRTALQRLVRSLRDPEMAIPDRLFRTIVENSADMVCHIRRGRFTYVSPAAAKVFGLAPERLIGQHALSLVHPEDRSAIEAVVARAIAGAETTFSVRSRMRCGDGSFKWCEASSASDPATSGEDAVLVMRDISERVRLEEELARFALQDGLTGLANRRAFDQSLERTWAATLAEGGEMTLLLLDIDHFKQFNDAHGHQVGDDCLRAVSNATRAHASRPGQTACRYGGEELAVILSGAGSDMGMQVAEEIRAAVEALAIPHRNSSCSDRVTVSVGAATAVARIGGSMKMPGGLLRAADDALYEAKRSGRNRVGQTVIIAPRET